MPDRNARTDRDVFQGLDDVESELMGSAREATVGYIPDPQAWALLAPANRGRPQPWQLVRDQNMGSMRRA